MLKGDLEGYVCTWVLLLRLITDYFCQVASEGASAPKTNQAAQQSSKYV